MFAWLSVELATGIAVALMGVFGVFHVLVVLGIVSADIVWGGRLDSRSKVLRAEAVSLVVMAGAIAVVLLNAGSIAAGLRAPWLTVAVWTLVAVFALNTVGNLFARTRLERFAFTPVTLAMTALLLRLALQPGLARP